MIEWCSSGTAKSSAPRHRMTPSPKLAALAGQNPGELLQRYWQARPGYDLGQPAARCWSPALGRDLAGQPSLVDQLTGVDVRGWLRLNCLSLRTRRRAAQAS